MGLAAGPFSSTTLSGLHGLQSVWESWILGFDPFQNVFFYFNFILFFPKKLFWFLCLLPFYICFRSNLLVSTQNPAHIFIGIVLAAQIRFREIDILILSRLSTWHIAPFI